MTLYLMDNGALDEMNAVMSRQYDAAAFAAYQIPVSEKKVGTIQVNGVLLPKADKLMSFMGVAHTVYSDIVAQVEQAKAENMDAVTIEFNSPGGAVEGLASAIDAINAIDIKIDAVANGKMLSAAYMLGAAISDTITAENDATLIGSFGVKIAMCDSGCTQISNSESPDKTPDPATAEGKAEIQSELSDIYARLAERVAKGRRTDVETINETYGKGATMTAKTALAKRMIDVIGISKTAGSPAPNNGRMSMDLNKLKAEHPDVYAQVYEIGVEAGKNEFKELAEAHLTLAEASGAAERALQDIKAMNTVSQSVIAFHSAEGIKRHAIEARQDESVEDVAEGEDPKAEALTDAEAFDAMGDELVAIVKGELY